MEPQSPAPHHQPAHQSTPPPAQSPEHPSVHPSLQHPQLAPTPEKRDGWRQIFSFLGTLGLIIAVWAFFTLFVFSSYIVDGPSMESTLQNHDRLIVLKLPRAWARLTHHSYIPARGDIIVFNERGLATYGDNSDSKALIKRVVGLPGERVVVKDGAVTVFNSAHPDGFSPDKTMPYGSVIFSTAGNVDVTVPAGEVFVFGDNRPNSLDSRYFGTVEAKDIIGKLGLRIYPFNGPHIF
jgi:signal peptidase I